MLTIENLRKFGANTDEGVARCLDSEEFYLELVQSALEDGDPSSLRQALEAKDTRNAFELAHALKGIYSNLSLTPLLTPTSELTESLRKKELPSDNAMIDTILAQFQKLKALSQ